MAVFEDNYANINSPGQSILLALVICAFWCTLMAAHLTCCGPGVLK
jgi:hypothetical protein